MYVRNVLTQSNIFSGKYFALVIKGSHIVLAKLARVIGRKEKSLGANDAT